MGQFWRALKNQLAELESSTGLHGTFGPSYVQWGGVFGNAILTRGRIVRAQVHPLPCQGEPRTLLEATVPTGYFSFSRGRRVTAL